MKHLEKEAHNFLKERGWDNLRPSDLAKSISIEAAELLENFQWCSLTSEQTKKDKEKIEQVRKELGDVFLYAIYLSLNLGFDTKKLILDKLERARAKYPPHKIKRKEGVDPGTEKEYLKIKIKHRRSGK